jgi:hypothetical protein
MKDKLEITKVVVHNMTGYAIGAATGQFFRTFRRHSDNKTVELLIDVSTLITVFAVSALAHEPVRDYTDAQIDKAAAWWKENVTPKLQK